MSTVEVKIDLDEFYQSFTESSIVEDMRRCLLLDMSKKIRRDPRYKELLDKKIGEAVLAIESGALK